MHRYIQVAAACGACLAMAAAAHATDPTVTFTLTDGTFDDGGSFSGAIVGDEVTYTDTWDIITTGGSTLFGTEYSSSSTSYTNLTSELGAFLFSAGSPSGTTLELVPVGFPAFSGTLSGSEYAYTGSTSGSPSRMITGGTYVITMSGAPEPAAWATMLVGTAFAGSALRRRRTTAQAA